jgi:hypothetical protein
VLEYSNATTWNNDTDTRIFLYFFFDMTLFPCFVTLRTLLIRPFRGIQAFEAAADDILVAFEEILERRL